MSLSNKKPSRTPRKRLWRNNLKGKKNDRSNKELKWPKARCIYLHQNIFITA
jgi:hypothetical protein